MLRAVCIWVSLLPLVFRGCEGRATEGEYPFLDAMISSFVASGRKAPSLSLEPFFQYLSCSSDDRLIGISEKSIMEQISDAIDIGLEMSGSNKGRVVETINENVQIGENFGATVKSVTLACYLINNDIYAGVYASEIIWDPTSDDVIGTSVDPSTRNMTMVLEADVMELPTANLLFVPRKHCFDLDSYDRGLSSSSSQTGHVTYDQSLSRTTLPVSFGSAPVTLEAYIGILGVHKFDFMSKEELQNMTRSDYLPAYEYPKAEMVMFSRALDLGLCDTATVGECLLIAEDLAAESNIELSENRQDGITWGMLTANAQFEFFRARRDELVAMLPDLFVPGGVPFNFPFIFDSRFASAEKNALYAAYATNPFYSQSDFETMVGMENEDYETESSCLSEQNGEEASEAFAFSLKYKQALTQRLKEFDGAPDSRWDNWFQDEFSATVTSLYEDRNIFNETVFWEHDSASGQYRLQPGNLTERKLGKTADYIVGTHVHDSSALRMILERRQRSVQSLNRATSRAFEREEDPPCRERATNSDFLLLVLAMAAAAAGGMQGIVEAFHKTLRMITVFVFRKDKRCTVIGWKVLLPTYELFLAILGVAILIALLLPAYIQVQGEYEVSSYKTSGSDVEVLFDTHIPDPEDPPIPTITGGAPILVTLANVETRCVDARPQLLMAIFIVGTILTVLLNAPFLFRVFQTVFRYTSGIRQGRRDVPNGTSIRDIDLRIFDSNWSPSESGASLEQQDCKAEELREQPTTLNDQSLVDANIIDETSFDQDDLSESPSDPMDDTGRIGSNHSAEKTFGDYNAEAAATGSNVPTMMNSGFDSSVDMRKTQDPPASRFDSTSLISL